MHRNEKKNGREFKCWGMCFLEAVSVLILMGEDLVGMSGIA